MKITPQNNIPGFSLPLPIYNSIHIADAIGRDGEEFGVFIGLDKKYAEQLKQLSLDKKDVDLQKNTGDKKRFGEGLYEDWYKKNRTPFTLVHKQTDILAAIAWFGPEPLLSNKANWHTAAWRSYNPFRGKGLMKNFTDFVMNIYTQNVKNTGSEIKLWIAVKRGNPGSFKLASALGFQVLEEASDEFSLVMTK